MTANQQSYTDADLGALLPLPKADHNKYSRGRVSIIAGSRRYAGAALLATLAATRSGAGYVTLATTASAAAAARVQAPTVPVLELPEDEEASGGIFADDTVAYDVRELTIHSDAVLIGPGLGRDRDLMALVRELVIDLAATADSDNKKPAIVLDADALFAFSGEHLDALPREYPIVLTPHSGELERLLSAHEPVKAIDEAVAGGCVFVAKGPRTTIWASRSAVTEEGAPSSLATAGSGDVLAGIITALLAQGLEASQAALLGVRLQTKAALAATADKTPLCMNARDLIDYLPVAAGMLLKAAGGDKEYACAGGIRQ